MKNQNIPQSARRSIRQRNIINTLFGLLFVLASFYIYTVISTTIIIAETREIENEISKLSDSILKSEVEYYKLSETLTNTDIMNRGFSPASKVNFVSITNERASRAFAILD